MDNCHPCRQSHLEHNEETIASGAGENLSHVSPENLSWPVTAAAWPATHVARKVILPVQNGTNLKVDFFECLDPPRCHMSKKFGFHHCP